MAEVGNAQREAAVPELSFYTDEYTITSGMALTINHGLPNKPRQVWLSLVCLTAELGYAVGDSVEIASDGVLTTVASNAIQIKFTFATLPTVVNFSTQASTAITAANWHLRIKAEV